MFLYKVKNTDIANKVKQALPLQGLKILSPLRKKAASIRFPQ